MKWEPRHSVVILKAELKPEKASAKIKITSPDGEYYLDDYNYYVFKKGEDCRDDLSIGDQVYFNLANAKLIHEVTDRKSESTFFYTLGPLIEMYTGGPIQLN